MTLRRVVLQPKGITNPERFIGDIKDKLKKAIKDGLSEDNEKDAELELQKIHDKYIKKLDDLLAEKQKEIMTV